MFFTYDYGMVDGAIIFPDFSFPDKSEGPPVVEDVYTEASAISVISIGGSVEDSQ